ncbi:MAG: Hsp20 family protein [Pseudomonadota bacterium]
MTGASRFDSPFLLGFDQIQRVIDRAAKSAGEGYPPYNIEEMSANAWRITLAVAGFAKADLSATVEDNQLVVRGQTSDEKDRVYLHRGIAARRFQRSFVLADGVDVSGAHMENGLLHIDLTRKTIAADVKTINIASPQGAS